MNRRLHDVTKYDTIHEEDKMTDEVREAAQKAIDAMHEFYHVAPSRGAVVWLEDSDGRVLVFTRGEHRDKLMASLEHPRKTVFFGTGEEAIDD